MRFDGEGASRVYLRRTLSILFFHPVSSKHCRLGHVTGALARFDGEGASRVYLRRTLSVLFFRPVSSKYLKRFFFFSFF